MNDKASSYQIIDLNDPDSAWISLVGCNKEFTTGYDWFVKTTSGTTITELPIRDKSGTASCRISFPDNYMVFAYQYSNNLKEHVNMIYSNIDLKDPSKQTPYFKWTNFQLRGYDDETITLIKNDSWMVVLVNWLGKDNRADWVNSGWSNEFSILDTSKFVAGGQLDHILLAPNTEISLYNRADHSTYNHDPICLKNPDDKRTKYISLGKENKNFHDITGSLYAGPLNTICQKD